MSEEYQTYNLGDWSLQSGQTIKNARIAYKSFGNPSSPTIIYPTWYSGSENYPYQYLLALSRTLTLTSAISNNEWLIGETHVLNPAKYYIIIPALFGNSQSSSPSNSPENRPFPNVTFYDNVRAQYKLVTEHLGVKHAKAVLGWSMGAGQTYQVISPVLL
jgi:homoserine acetyltransferase